VDVAVTLLATGEKLLTCSSSSVPS